jgi:hypothetical protein
MKVIVLLFFVWINESLEFQSISFSSSHRFSFQVESLNQRKSKSKRTPSGDVEDVVSSYKWLNQNFTAVEKQNSDKLSFPEENQAAIDEKALRNSVIGKFLFGVIDVLFPVFKEPNWFDVYGIYIE